MVEAPVVTAAAIAQFERVDLAFSLGEDGKCCQSASTAWLRRPVKTAMAKQGINVQAAGVHLGVDMPM